MKKTCENCNHRWKDEWTEPCTICGYANDNGTLMTGGAWCMEGFLGTWDEIEI